MLLCAGYKRDCCLTGEIEASCVGLLDESEVEEFGCWGDIKAEEHDAKHHSSIWVHFDVECRGGYFHSILNLCLNDFPFDCTYAHAGEEDDEDSDDSDRDNSSCGGVVLGLAVVPDEFGGGEKV